MKIDGGCHCGFLAYEAEVDPGKVGICHCTDCQSLSGTVFRTTVMATKDAFKLTKGTPKVYVKTAESGAKRAQAFCPECGTQVYSTDPVKPELYFIRGGTARQRAELVPKVQTWTRSKLSWLNDLESMPSFETRPPMP